MAERHYAVQRHDQELDNLFRVIGGIFSVFKARSLSDLADRVLDNPACLILLIPLLVPFAWHIALPAVQLVLVISLLYYVAKFLKSNGLYADRFEAYEEIIEKPAREADQAHKRGQDAKKLAEAKKE